VDADQHARANPFGMSEDCEYCPALVECRERVVHGYGDVAADFLFVGEAPSAASERAGIPFVGDAAGETVQSILGYLGLNNSLPTSDAPELENVYLTHVTRCRHPGRGPTEEEVESCEPYLNAEIRTINPEVLVPVGERALAEIAAEYTTTPAAELSAADDHATTVRGRGFALVPMKAPAEQTEAETEAFIDHFEDLMAGDYRQTKGRRER
jgi:uracil-DNA glycosylase family 4